VGDSKSSDLNVEGGKFDEPKSVGLTSNHRTSSLGKRLSIS